MERYNKENLRNIQRLVQSGTGADIGASSKSGKNSERSSGGIYVRGNIYIRRRMKTVLIAACLICIAVLSAFAYAEFTMLDAEKLGLAAAYQGDGKFEIVITNFSDKRLELQDKVKVMQWSTGEEVQGYSDKIEMSGLTVKPDSQGIVSIDISNGYDIEAMEKVLPDGDWYYFVLTNNNFVFGQDWMCSFDFTQQNTEAVMQNSYTAMTETMQRRTELAKEKKQVNAEESLICADWIWPTVSKTVSVYYGETGNGNFSDHINIAGTAGDEVYAVTGGTVAETGFDAYYGNYIILRADSGEDIRTDSGEDSITGINEGGSSEISVKYGHLKDINVSAGDQVKQNQVIGTLGQSGAAAGANLSFAVMKDGETVNPLAEQ